MHSNQYTLKSIVKGLLYIAVLSVIISLFFYGPKIFQSFKYFVLANSYAFSVGLAFWTGNWAISVFTGQKLNWKKNPVNANLIALSIFFVYGILVSILLAFLFEKYLFKNKGEGFSEAVMINSFINLAIDLVFVSIFYSGYLVRYWQKSLQNEEELKRENLKARYEALNNQLNPHFLFNSLNTLCGIVESDQESATEYIKKLSDTYRYVLEQRDKELVPVEEELRFINDYLYMVRARHGIGLVVNINLSDINALIAPLGLQMLIENSIKHNVITDDEPLIIDISSENDYVIVSNNLRPKKVIQDHQPMGLENLKNRYAYLADKEVTIEVNDHNFTVKIPMIKDQ